MTIVLGESGSCSFSEEVQPEQENPSGEVDTLSFEDRSYSLVGTDLTVSFVAEEGEEGGIEAQLSNGQMVFSMLIWDDAHDSDVGETEDAVFVLS